MILGQENGSGAQGATTQTDVIINNSSLTAEVRDKLLNEYKTKLEDLRKLGIDFKDADFGKLISEKGIINTQAQNLVEEFYGYFEKMGVKVENFSKFNDDETGVIVAAQKALEKSSQQFKAAEAKYAELLERPRGGLKNAIINFFSGLKRRTLEASEQVKIAEAKEAGAKAAVAEAGVNAEKMRKIRIENMDATAFIYELTKIAENLKRQKVEDRAATGGRIQITRDETKRTKEKIAAITKSRDELWKAKSEKEAEIEKKSAELNELKKDSAEYIASESAIDIAKTQLNALSGQHDSAVAELETHRTQLLEYATQDKQLTTQWNTLDLAIRVLDASIPYVKSSIENAIILAKNANMIELFSNQHKTNNFMDEAVMKTAIMTGLAAQQVVKDTFREQKEHGDLIKKIITQGSTEFTKNQKEIKEAKDDLDAKSPNGNGNGNHNGNGGGGGGFNPNQI